MTDTYKDNNKDGTDGGVSVNKDGINCLFCRCKRNTYHKETKTTTENDEVVVNVVENRSSLKWDVVFRRVMEYLNPKNLIKSEVLKYATQGGATKGLPPKNAMRR